jgi:class 3 adenylate cyclase
MEAMEQKITQLDSMAVEIRQTSSKMEELINAMLPPVIAKKFIAGQPVEPEFYDCVTVMFSDIVGFTSLSAQITPTQVMKFLNDMWTVFDAILDQFDAYKVDTIGTVTYSTY